MVGNSSQRTEQRKRNRKRKRRNASPSSSSDSSDSSSDENAEVVKLPAKAAGQASSSMLMEEHESDSSSSSSSEEETSFEPSSTAESLRVVNPVQPAASQQSTTHVFPSSTTKQPVRPATPPPVRNVPAPNLIPPRDSLGNMSLADSEKETILKERFRKLWLSSIADAFSDDLNEIRKEPNLNQSRLGMMIDALAAGADVYSTSRQMGDSEVNEIEIILGQGSTGSTH